MNTQKQNGTKKQGSGHFEAGPLPLIAKAIGRKLKVQVVVSSEVKVPHTDGKTIYLPGLQVYGSPEEVIKLNAFLDHEAGHIRYTEFGVMKGATPLEKLLLNILEDPRIEGLMEKAYPGCRINFEACLEIEQAEAEKSKIAKGPATEQPDPLNVFFGALLQKLFVDILGRQIWAKEASERWANAEKLFGKDLLAAVYIEAKKGATAVDTQGAMEAAREVIKLLNLPNSPAPQQMQIQVAGFRPHDEDSEDGENGQSAKGKGTGKGKGSEKTDKPGSGQGSGSGDSNTEKAGQDESGSGGETSGTDQGDEDSGKGEGGGDSENPEAVPGEINGTGAGPTGTHTGNEAVKTILDASSQSLTELQAQLDHNQQIGQALAEKSRETRAHSVSDKDIKPTPWSGSASDVAILNVDQITRPLRMRLEAALESRMEEAYYPVKAGTRNLRRKMGLYGTGIDHIFQKREEASQLDTAIHITFDISGSMGSGKRLSNAKLATICLGDAIFGFDGVELEVTAFDTTVFTFQSDWRKARQQIASIPAHGGTSYAPSFLYGIDRLAGAEATRKLFILVTDGDPSDADESAAIAAYALRQGIETFGLAIEGRVSPALTQIFGKNAAAIQQVQELPAILGQLVEQNL